MRGRPARSRGDDEYNAFFGNWKKVGRTDIISSEYEDILQPLIEDYDAIVAPIQNMEHLLQIKFNPRIQDNLNRWSRTIEELPR